MNDLKKKHTREEILDLINGHLEKGKKSKVKYILTLTTRLRTKERKEIVQGLRELNLEDITTTDLTDINKAGCSVGAAAVLFVSCSIIYNLIF